MFRMFLSLIINVCLLVSFGFSQDTEWKLSKDENDIKVYRRKVEGFAIEELKTTFLVKAPLNAVVAVIKDADRYSEWIYSCAESKVLKKINETEQYQYLVNDVPYPFNDRDIAVHFKIWQEAETKKVFTSSIGEADYIPKKNGRIRVPTYIGEYELTPLSNTEVEINYRVKLDPGGKIPEWMVNLFIVKGPYESSLNMRERIESGEYDEAQFDFLQN